MCTIDNTSAFISLETPGQKNITVIHARVCLVPICPGIGRVSRCFSLSLISVYNGPNAGLNHLACFLSIFLDIHHNPSLTLNFKVFLRITLFVLACSRWIQMTGNKVVCMLNHVNILHSNIFTLWQQHG